MDSPRDPDDGAWHEPSHLGRDGDGAGDASPAGDPDPTPAPGPRAARRPRGNPLLEALAHRGDPWGVQAWALGVGWEVSDGTGPRDGVLAEVVAGSPLRLGREARPAGVVRGRAGTLELVAFDVVYASGRHLVPEYAVTAAPVLVPLPAMRLSPARLWRHRTGGLLQVPSGDPEFDTRWVLLTAEDGPPARALVQDPAVRGLLLGSDDGDEFWSAAGHVAAIRLDGHRPQLIEHHARLLTAVVGALAAAY
jgi:hypothetical protein